MTPAPAPRRSPPPAPAEAYEDYTDGVTYWRRFADGRRVERPRPREQPLPPDLAAYWGRRYQHGPV